MKWRLKLKRDWYGELDHILQVKKWWMLKWRDCWYKIEECDGDEMYQLRIGTTDPTILPDTDTIRKEDLYYNFCGFFFKV